MLALLLASPLLVEFLSGNTSSLPALFGFATLNGAGAVLVREAAVRRAGHRGSTTVLLALAYGVLEEGLLNRDLFDPSAYGGLGTEFGFVPAVGISVPVTIYEVAVTALAGELGPV